MLKYLEKFNQLPDEIKAGISSPGTMSAIKELEAQYGVNLATIVMRIVVKDISLLDLAKYFVFEFGLDARQAERLVEDLKNKVLKNVSEYLGIAIAQAPAVDSEDEGQLNSWMQARKNETEVRSSNFFFSSEDEEEVKNLAKKVENFKIEKTVPEIVIDYDGIINKVVKDIGISFSSSDMENRFRSVMTTFLKGIRNRVDIKQALIKGIDSGGLGINEIYADNILVLTVKTKEEFANQAITDSSKEGGNISIKKEEEQVKTEIARDVDYDYKNMPTLKKDPEPVVNLVEKTIDNQRSSNVLKEATGVTQKQTATVSERLQQKEPIKIKESEKKVLVKNPNVVPLNIRSNETGSRRKIEDVKHVPKLIGPIEELRDMDMVNFRRLDVDPGERIRKILEKINFLEEESYGQRLAGINGWRKSKVNDLYLEIGRESITKHQGVDHVIEDRRAKGEEYLTEEEFMAIMELNRNLRY